MADIPETESARRIGTWRVVRPLGKGGMAEVYEVEDERFGSRYALKLFTYARAEEATVRERFFAEGRLLAKLDHPRLVRVYDMGEDEATGRPFFVMDLVLDPEGRPRTLAEVAAPDEEQVAIWYEDLREGLAYIHGRGILHRDLKLQNVLVGPDGHAVLSDFGVAKIFDKRLREEVGLTAEQTLMAVKDGKTTVMGSVGYLAPEVEMGVAASKESDWYALGVLVFRLLTGVWCDARTDVAGDLDSYNPVWLQILPKLLHLNPAGRACPSWRELEKAHLAEEAYKAEVMRDELGTKRHEAVRGRRNAWIAAFAAAVLAATLACFVQRKAAPIPPPSPEFEEIFSYPADAPRPKLQTMGGDADAVALASVDAWVLMRRPFAAFRAGSRGAAELANDALAVAARAESEDENLFSDVLPGYTRWGGAGIFNRSAAVTRVLPTLLRRGAAALFRRAGDEESARKAESAAAAPQGASRDGVAPRGVGMGGAGL